MTPTPPGPASTAGEAGLPPDLADLAGRFVLTLRTEGLVVPVDGTVLFCRALAALGAASPAGVYWAGRTTLTTARDDIPAYDRAFRRFWLQRAPERSRDRREPAEEFTLSFDDPDPPSGSRAESDESPRIEVRYSPEETLRTRDFAACTPEELAEAFRLIDRLDLHVPQRRSRRLRPGHGPGRRPDTRGAVRRALRTGGELVERPTRAPTQRPRQLVLLCDVSGSMEPYARALLRFLHAVVASRHVPVEAFAFATRLTRLTRQLRPHHPDQALDDAAASVADYSGGTRLGAVLREFNDRWGVRGMARGAVVVVLSDGWDRGDPAQLAAEMARLGRVARTIVWVNPLKADARYQPLARGMAAALPHVDHFVPGHSVAALEELAGLLGSALERSAHRRRPAWPGPRAVE